MQFLDSMDTRQTRSKGKLDDQAEKANPIIYQNKAAVMVANSASLVDLNSRIQATSGDPVTMDRFKPNMIIGSNKPWIEDNWDSVVFSDDVAQLVKVNRCDRCVQITVDRESAKFGREPMKTLKT